MAKNDAVLGTRDQRGPKAHDGVSGAGAIRVSEGESLYKQQPHRRFSRVSYASGSDLRRASLFVDLDLQSICRPWSVSSSSQLAGSVAVVFVRARPASSSRFECVFFFPCSNREFAGVELRDQIRGVGGAG